jgi:hypothetical protein
MFVCNTQQGTLLNSLRIVKVLLKGQLAHQKIACFFHCICVSEPTIVVDKWTQIIKPEHMVLIFNKMVGSLKFEHYFLVTLNFDQVICLEHTVNDSF